ncbi:MAG: helix-turn-helix transcriptional regulator, partial [Flavobacteriaceae bacterium]|nr:helix-turn-helix transcriptional regulator [Flavobacteriaceae bacterium]
RSKNSLFSYLKILCVFFAFLSWALAKLLNTNHSIIGKYERDEVKPTIDVVKRLAEALDTNVGYLLGETENSNILKDSSMLKRLNDIASFSKQEQERILFALDAMITKIKLGSI